MKPLLSIKTLYRTPVKTLLTFVLLGVVTFAFVVQTAEYAVTAREFYNAAKQYCGVGSAEVAPPEESDPANPFKLELDDTVTHLYRPLTQEQISDISALPYIISTDTRYMTAGISDTYDRLDDGRYFYNFTARCVIEGTLTGVNYIEPPNSVNYLMLADCTLLAGNPPWEIGQKPLVITAFTTKLKPGNAAGLGRDTRSILIITSDYKYDTEYIQNMTTGNRYVFVLRFDPLVGQEYDLSDHLSNPWCDAVWPIGEALDDKIETDEFAPLRELVEITNADLHTFDMVYTNDMYAILRFAEGDMAILNGRALNKEDSASGSDVCVVSREFAEANHLEVGDKITMKLGTKLFEQYKNLGAVAATPERYALAEKTATLEIVGIYTDSDGPNSQSKEPHWSYSVNTIFVPKSLFPLDADALAGHMFSPAEFSFKVENAWDIPAFLEKTAPMIERMGLKLIFYDDGWLDIANGFQAARQVSLIKIAVLSAAVAAADVFIVYLFIGRKKKEYAVMRALGTTKRIASRALVLPQMSVAAVSVLVGSGAAWLYTVKTVARNNAFAILKEYAVSTSVPAGAVIGSIAGEILLTLLFTLVLLRRIGTLPPLALLQDNGNKKARSKKNASRAAPTQIETISPMLTASSAPFVITPTTAAVPNQAVASIEEAAVSGIPEAALTVRKSSSFGFIQRYIWRHTRRSAGKSALVILLAALLFGAVGQLALMKQQYAELCAETVITAKFIGGLQLATVPKIMKTGYVVNPYYEVRKTVELNFSRTELVVTNNITRYTGVETDIKYAKGFDASVMDQFGDFIIAGKALTELYGLGLGDTVTINPTELLTRVQASYITMHRGAHPKEVITDEEILVLHQDEIIEGFNRQACTFTIAGILTSSDAYNSMVFTPGSYAASALFGAQAALDVVEFTLADNFRADDFRADAQQVCDSSTSSVVFIMDTSKLEHLRNTLKLLETMYPIAMTAALLIGGFLCCLVIVQSSKEAAIMRIQGTTKRKTRTILALEHLFLSIFGLAIGACGLLLYKGLSLSVISWQLSLFAALYFAVILVSAMVCSAAATRRNVLELLQTKD